MYIDVGLHIHTYIHTYIRTYIRTYIHTYIHTYEGAQISLAGGPTGLLKLLGLKAGEQLLQDLERTIQQNAAGPKVRKGLFLRLSILKHTLNADSYIAVF